jgi:ATP-dependent Clp protease adaptor protein ClpS
VTTLAPAEVEVARPSEVDEPEHDRPWVVIVWNDPINLMSYVTLVFQKLFGYTLEHATKLMLQVHNDGKSVVAAGTREKAELDVARLHSYGLWATMQQD